MAAPSLRKLTQSFGETKAKAIRGLVTGAIDPKTYKRVTDWLAQCHNEPGRDELIMCAIDEVLAGYGVEAIRGRYVDKYHQDIQAAYVNLGDTYDTTILLDHETGNFVLTSLGDWVERNTRRREIA